MAANVKVDVRKNDSIEGLYKINFIDIEPDKSEKIVVSIDCGIESLYLIRDVISNAIKIIEAPSIANN